MIMNATRWKVLFVVVTTLMISACATSIKSTIDSAGDTDLSEFETYAWISDTPYVAEDAVRSELVNPLNYQRIRAGIDVELQHKGYRKVAIDEADLVLGVTLGTRDRVRVQQYYNDFGYRYYGYSRFNRFSRFSRFNRFNRFGGYRGFGRSFGPSVTTRVRTFTEGSVALDVFDTESRQAIWQGHASRSLTSDPMGKRLIADAISALIGPLPARPAVVAGVPADSAAASVVM